jgi:twinkle protein
MALTARGITEETCAFWGYTGTTFNDKPAQVANYRDTSGQIVAQKVRMPGKEFLFLGDTKKAGLYGQHLWRDGGKRVVITEGEIDALSVSQVQGNRWPVVSLPNGASGAKKSIEQASDWLEKFDEVVLLFDNDEPGQKAAKECAAVLKPGKAKIAKLPLKDANEMLKAGQTKELIDAIWGAKVYRPDGLVSGTELWDTVSQPDPPGRPYPWEGLTAMTRGMRPGELITLCAGSGIGKSQIVREIAYSLLQAGETVGYIALEESTKRSALGFMSLDMNKALHIGREGVEDEAFKAAFVRTVGSGRLYLYDHFGSLDCDNLLQRVRYLARGCGCRFIVLDHISIVVSGMGDGDERRLIDNAMTALASLVQETGITLFVVSHLRRPEGDKGHEEGARVSLNQLRGSHSIPQLSNLVIGLERDQQSAKNKHLTTVRVLKNRHAGDAGVACVLSYDPQTTRLTEVDAVANEPEPSDLF